MGSIPAGGKGLRIREWVTYILGHVAFAYKAPADLSAINAGKPWSAMDLADLDDFLTDCTSIKGIASYLCREVDEVEAKIASLRN
jgi:hypothetical protein